MQNHFIGTSITASLHRHLNTQENADFAVKLILYQEHDVQITINMMQFLNDLKG